MTRLANFAVGYDQELFKDSDMDFGKQNPDKPK